MFKEEIKRKAKELLNEANEDDFQVVINNDDEITIIYENQKFRYMYCGSKTLVKWLKGKSYHFYISGSKFNQLFLFIKNCIEQKLDPFEQLNKMKQIQSFKEF